MIHGIHRVAVLGGSRFVGHAIVEALLARGCRVLTLNRGVSPVQYSAPVARICADRKDPEGYFAALTAVDADAVVDVTAYHPEESRIVCETFRGRVHRFVHISTLSVYQWPAACPVSEESPLETNPLNAYGFEKARCEQVISSESTARLPWTLLRLPPVVGPGDPFSREVYLYRQIQKGKTIVLPPRPYQCQNLHVADAARAVCELMESPRAVGRVYNVGGAPFTLEAYVDHIAGAVGKPAQMMRADTRVLLQSNADPRKIPYYFEGDVVLDTRRIFNDIGFEPQWPLEKALAATLREASGSSMPEDVPVWGLPWDTPYPPLGKANAGGDGRRLP